MTEYSKNYSKTSSIKDFLIDPITNSESYKYKTIITGKTADDGNAKEGKLSVTLKHLSHFSRTLDMPLINCEVSLTLTWS